jgi:hypothetical protein
VEGWTKSPRQKRFGVDRAPASAELISSQICDQRNSINNMDLRVDDEIALDVIQGYISGSRETSRFRPGPRANSPRGDAVRYPPIRLK